VQGHIFVFKYKDTGVTIRYHTIGNLDTIVGTAAAQRGRSGRGG
jgi:hypothetical protein